MPRLQHDALFWRQLAHLGASRGPEWLVRYSPTFFGLAAAVLVPSARQAVSANLRRIRGPAPAGAPAWARAERQVRHAVDVGRTFTTYAGCLAEVLSNGSKNARLPTATIRGEDLLVEALKKKRGVVLVTMHTAGWETAGPLLQNAHGVDVLMVMAPEPDEEARKLQDSARIASGLGVTHVKGDPLASLKLLHHLRKNGVVALQIDRQPPDMRLRKVTLFGEETAIPEGPLHLASIAGAPVVPLFCARTGYREYIIDIRAPMYLPRRMKDQDLDAAARSLASSMASFLGEFPTSWFHFRNA